MNQNRTFSESTPRSSLTKQEEEGGHSLNSNSDDNNLLSLFSSPSPPPSSLLPFKLGMISTTTKHAPSSLNPLDHLFASSSKHDYDWLLTPPETPLHASSHNPEFHSNLAPSSRHGIGNGNGNGNGNGSMSRSGSATKPSRLSTSHLDSNHSSRPARSRSVTRSSVSSTLSNNYSSSRSSSILNTSSASVSSYIRPSSPATRSSSTSRPATPSARTCSSRSSTPSKARSAPCITSTDRSRPSTNSRPSTPSSRPQIPANLSFPTTRSNSRPSTPTRRNSISTPSAAPSISTASGRAPSRPSSPSPRVRPQPPVIPPDFPLDTPPNLRTTLSDRAVSAGRSRPGASLTSKVNMETPSSVHLPRRQSSPVVARGRSVEPQGRGHMHSNGHHADVNVSEPRRSTYVPDSVRKPVKTSPTSEGGGLGRTISKKSLDMAIKHMDIRNGAGTTRPHGSTSLFPQSVRSVPSRIQTKNGGSSPSSSNSNGSPSISNNGSYESGIYSSSSSSKGCLENGKKRENGRVFGRLADVDMFESTRYDAILLKEDLRNTTWLHSVDDHSDHCSIFDGGFESLPEPFGLL